MHYCKQGDLLSIIKARRKKHQYFEEAAILKWFVQVALGLKHIHDHKILHRDLKTENLFLDGKDNLYIGDFGIGS